ncbi:MAG: hypothetical protein H7240_09155 [Glaciimonas sp.]|nr:hypothetical protein [Glaciimonas sp.]
MIAFSFAFHLTDVRPNIVKGIRTLLLVLMACLLPVAVMVIGGFFISTVLLPRGAEIESARDQRRPLVGSTRG